MPSCECVSLLMEASAVNERPCSTYCIARDPSAYPVARRVSRLTFCVNGFKANDELLHVAS